jgi:hypothetical protein
MKRLFVVLALAASASTAIAQQKSPYRAVTVPSGFDNWKLSGLEDLGQCVRASRRPESDSAGGTAIVLDARWDQENGNVLAYSVRIVDGDDSGKRGWICANLLQITEESERLEANINAAAAAAERKRKRARDAQHEAEDRVRQAAEDAKTAKIRAACTVIYARTVDKKVGDLTVRETQQVQACQLAGMYPPG